MGKKKAVKLGINLGQYPNEGGGCLEKSDSCFSIYYMCNNVDICKYTIDQYEYRVDMIVIRDISGY